MQPERSECLVLQNGLVLVYIMQRLVRLRDLVCIAFWVISIPKELYTYVYIIYKPVMSQKLVRISTVHPIPVLTQHPAVTV